MSQRNIENRLKSLEQAAQKRDEQRTPTMLDTAIEKWGPMPLDLESDLSALEDPKPGMFVSDPPTLEIYNRLAWWVSSGNQWEC